MSFDVHNVPVESIPRVHVRPGLLKPEFVSVEHDGGELVTIRLGNVEVRMHYEDAIKISQWIRIRAKQAKRFCGDVSRHWSALATLEDLNAKKPVIF